MDSQAKEQAIIDYLKRNSIGYIEIENEDNIEYIYNAYFNGIFRDDVSAIVNNYYGVYYRIGENIEKAIRYYSRAADMNYPPAVMNLSNIYKNNKIKDNKYIVLAASLGSLYSIEYLVNYYKKNNDHENMMKYLTMAADLNDVKSIVHLSNHYEEKNDHDNMMKYLVMGVNLNDVKSMVKLVSYYEEQNDHDNMMKYYTIAANSGDSEAISKLLDFYCKTNDQEKVTEYFLKAINLIYQDLINKVIFYYQNDEENKLKYLIIAADLGMVRQICELINYYRKFADDDNIIKYCLQLFSLDKLVARNQLIAIFNWCITSDATGDQRSTGTRERILRYYRVIEELGFTWAKKKLQNYYYSISDYQNMIKCQEVIYILGNEHIDKDAKILLTLFEINKDIFNDITYIDRILQILYKLLENNNDRKLLEIIDYIDMEHYANGPNLLFLYKKLLNEKIDLLDLHFRYAPDSKGFQEAKKDFISKLVIKQVLK